MSKPVEVDSKGREVDATLHNATLGLNGAYLYGTIYGDRKGRFRDGDRVRTSQVIEYDLSTGIAVTCNSVYRVYMYKAGGEG